MIMQHSHTCLGQYSTDKFATTTKKHIKKSPQVHKVNVCAMCAGHDDNPLMRRIQMSLCLEELNPVGGWGAREYHHPA